MSWGFAFRKGRVIWLWTIVWGIVGLIIGLIVGIAVSGGELVTVITDPTTIGREHISGILVGSLIGLLIISLGLCMSIVKIVAEATPEEAKK